MSTRISFVLISSGVFLFLSLISTSYATFSLAEFTDRFSECYFTAVRDALTRIHLPIDQVDVFVRNFEFDALIEFTIDYRVQHDPETIDFLESTLIECFDEFNRFKQYNISAGEDILLYDCACEKIKEERSLPNLPCDAIADAAGLVDGKLFEKLMGENGIDSPFSTNELDYIGSLISDCLGKCRLLIIGMNEMEANH
ncbi:hypothetical protein WDU94_003743 [Cyamophila willieti]